MTVTGPQITIFAILLVLLILLVWGRWRYDVAAFLALLASVLLGVVPAENAFYGFGHPATVTVAAILVLSRTLASSGATDWIGRLVTRNSDRPAGQIGLLSFLGAGLSAFMNNIGTLGLLMPVALQAAVKSKRPAAPLLMSLSFGSILGGLVTLIGTPPNIIIAAYRGEVSGTPFGLFDFAPVGLATALAGVAFIALIGWRLVPSAGKPGGAGDELFDIEGYVTEVRVPKDSKLVGETLAELDRLSADIDALVIDVIRGSRRFPGSMTTLPLEAGDILKIEAGPENIERFLAGLGVELAGVSKGANTDKAKLLDFTDRTLTEAVVAQGSRLEGRVVGSLRLFRSRGVALLAVSRQGKPFRGRLTSFRLRVGDVVLLHGDAERLPEAVSAAGCLPLLQRDLSFGQRRYAAAVAAIFGFAIALTAFGLVPIQIALGLAVAAVVVTGILPVRELYQGIDWPVVVLLGALIPVGGALQSTGATTLIAESILTLTHGFSPVVVLALIMIVTMTMSDVLNNAATAVVMAPIGVAIADRLNVASDPFLMAVAVAASCAFLTPIGHQNNALIMGPAGLKFGDYWRLGLPLEVLVVAVSLPMILWVWPL